LNPHELIKSPFPAPQFLWSRNELIEQSDDLGGDGAAVLAGAGAQGFVEVFGDVFYV
jgi:hypothetical protein